MWSESQSCWYWHGDQKSPDWGQLRSFAKGSSTAFGLAFGSRFGRKIKSAETYRKIMFGELEQEINEKMQLGIQDEHKIYEWHGHFLKDRLKQAIEEDEEIPNPGKVQMTTIGIAVSKKDFTYRSSPDSLVYDPLEADPYGIGEYKRTTKMYRQFLPKNHPDYRKKWVSKVKKVESTSEDSEKTDDPEAGLIGMKNEVKTGLKCNEKGDLGEAKGEEERKLEAPTNPTQIWDTHYAQIQHLLWVTGRSWCDYVVCCLEQKRWYIQRIRPNPEYWAKLYEAIEYKLEPYKDIISSNIFLLPTKNGKIRKDEKWRPSPEEEEFWNQIVPPVSR